MKKAMRRAAGISLILTALFLLACRLLPGGFWLSLAVSAGTVFYHLAMRLAVGRLFDRRMHNRADCGQRRYRVTEVEQKLYRRLGVRKWKKHLPTYEPELFDSRLHSWAEIAQAGCQAERVHETAALLSFLPLLAVPWLGGLPVFLITSLLAAGFDMLFVILQRRNRPRLLRLARKEMSRARQDSLE